MAAPVSYRVSCPEPHTHLVEVEAHFPAGFQTLDVSLPVWTPGSYLVREYARHVQQLVVCDLADAPVAFERLDKSTLRVTCSNKPFRLRYQVYANELTVRTSHLDSTHGAFNGATLFYYSEALRARQHRVFVTPPAGWRVTCALPSQGAEFLAENYDQLIDSPFELGTHDVVKFNAAGVPHEVVLWGGVQVDTDKLASDLTQVIETEAKLFGGLPHDRYVFFIYGTDRARGGLEHKASTSLVYPRNGFSTTKGWDDFLSLAAHEYFHLWNIKRIKPKRLVPFQYQQENYTELLWFFEGGTSYYDNLMVHRAGLMPASRYLTRVGENISALHSTPGRQVQTLCDASFLAWIKHYRPDENTVNSAISYYVKGEVVCLLLDLHLRALTNDSKCLDDVMRLLWSRYRDESGVPEDGIERAVAEVAGRDMKAFFDDTIRSVKALDYSVLSHVGLRLMLRPKESATDKGGTPPRSKNEKNPGYLGIVPKGSNGILSVLSGSPAMRGLLSSDDEIVALDNVKCDAAALIARCEDKKPGNIINITVFRREQLQQVTVVLGEKPSEAAYVVPVENPTAQQRQSYAKWLAQPMDA